MTHRSNKFQYVALSSQPRTHAAYEPFALRRAAPEVSQNQGKSMEVSAHESRLPSRRMLTRIAEEIPQPTDFSGWDTV